MKQKTELKNGEMIIAVNKFVKDLGLTDEILGLKTKNDKELYYYNYISPENNFRGLWELPNLYFIKLANLLCNTEERFKEFSERFYNVNKKLSDQLRKYRRYLIDSRDEQDNQEFLRLIQEQIHSKDWEQLYDILRELFLEPFDEWIMERIVKKNEEGLASGDLFNWYIKGNNIKSIINFKLDFIKTA